MITICHSKPEHMQMRSEDMQAELVTIGRRG